MDIAVGVLRSINERIQLTFAKHPRLAVTTVSFSVVTVWATRSFNRFLIHVGGWRMLFAPVPVVWMIAVICPLIAKERFTTGIYYQSLNRESWLSKDLSKREGERPSIGDFLLPHRQVSADQLPSKEMQEVR
jgi:hypothetical protein